MLSRGTSELSTVCVQVETVATTLSLAEQNHAEELKRVCLEFVSRNLQAVMVSEGYQHMVSSCPQLQVRACLPITQACGAICLMAPGFLPTCNESILHTKAKCPPGCSGLLMQQAEQYVLLHSEAFFTW